MTKNNTNLPIDLTLLKRTVEALETVLASSETMKDGDRIEYVLELNKALGFTSGLIGEASLLIGDIQHLIQQQSMGATPKFDVESLFGGLKGRGAN